MNALRILHVDDEPDIREVVGLSLELDPAIVLKSCDSGADALRLAADWRPDVVLLDVTMPEMDGPQILARMREAEATAAIPVVFMTARAQSREVEQFHAMGVSGVIQKPFDPLTLAKSVRDCVAA